MSSQILNDFLRTDNSLINSCKFDNLTKKDRVNVLQHSIPTVDDTPIFSTQYRFPSIHKEEITRQVDELIKNKIIKPSQSHYNTLV